MTVPLRRRIALAVSATAVLAAGGAALVTGTGTAVAAGAPSISVTPHAGLTPAGDTVTVTGTGFAVTGPGIYVGFADEQKVSPSNAGAFGAVKWVHLGATPGAGQDVLSADGTFSTTLPVKAVFGSGADATDCLVDSCVIATVAAHGSGDRSQDTDAPIAFHAPALKASATAALTDGQQVTLTGAGYKPAKGVYLAQTVARPETGYPSAYGNAKYLPSVAADGAFTQDVTVTPTFTPRGGAAVDCRAVQCYLASFNDHTDLQNRDQDVFLPIGFAAAPEPTTTPPDPSPSPTTSVPAPGTPAVQVTPTTGLPVTGGTVAVSGSGFATTGNGIYVGIASRAGYAPSSQDAFGAVKWVHLGATPSAGQDVLNADGTFSVTVPVEAVFGTGDNATDCRVDQCAIYTLAAHGSSDRSQDTATDITFAGSPDPSSPTASPSPSAAVPSGTVTLSSDSVRAGDDVTVTAAGFLADEQVQGTLHSDPVDLGISPADGDGDFSLTFTVPADLEPGAHRVDLLGLNSALALSVPLQVVGADATGDATSAASGTTSDEVVVAANAADTLASTGADPGLPIVLGLVLLFGGGTVLLVARRRPVFARRH